MNFVETDPRVLRLNQLHQLDKEDAEMMKKCRKGENRYKILEEIK